MKPSMLNYTIEELRGIMSAMAQPPYRADQLFSLINKKYPDTFKGLPGVSRDLAGKLEERFRVHPFLLAERFLSEESGTEKFLWELSGKQYVETVLISSAKRKTVCLSTQVGCKYRCPFCASGSEGYRRNLDAGEIVGQFLHSQKIANCRATNVVFMGMGEPLDNYDNLAKAIKIINHPRGIGLGARRILVSTCGVVPGIERLKGIGLQVELSVSLHATNNALRDELVPVNRKYPIEELVSSCKDFSRATGRIITLEYTLIQGKNDSDEDAGELARIAADIKGKVNLIALSACAPSRFLPADRSNLIRFSDILKRKRVHVTTRASKGSDILAACGQLAGKARRGKRRAGPVK